MRLEPEIIAWAKDRDILDEHGYCLEASRLTQYLKTHEEVGELLAAITQDDPLAARDAIGDVLVTLIIQASMWGLSIDDCVQTAWNEVRFRRGKIVNGIFVKEES